MIILPVEKKLVYSRIITITMLNKKILVPITLIVLIAAVLSPIVFTGYATLDQAQIEFAAKKYSVAAVSYERSARFLPWRTDLWERAGIASAMNGNVIEALDLFKRAPVLSADGWMWLGYSEYQTGDIPSAITSLEESIQRAPSQPAYDLLAYIYRQQKNWTAERDTLENQLQDNVGDVHTQYRLGLLLTVLEPGQALTNLMFASSLDPEFDPAVQTLRAALNLSATQSDASSQMITIGRALGLVQEWDLSMMAFENAIQLNAENAEAWAWLGEAKQQTGAALSVSKGQDGRAELDRALQLDHTSVIVRALRGLYWNRQKKYEQMLAEYLLAAEFEPTNPAWQAEVGNAYTMSGDLAAALEAYQQAIDLAPTDSTYWRLLAVFCSENGVHVEDMGLPAAHKAVELAPDDPLALDALGWSYFSSGRYANAQQTLLDVVNRFPNHFPAHNHLAMTYLAQGNQSAAFNELTYVRDADAGGASGLFAEQLLAKYFP